MDMKRMLAQAQAIQGKLTKFKKEEFTFSDIDGLVKIIITGGRKIVSINIEGLLKEAENDYSSINDMLQTELNKALKQIDEKEKNIAGKF
ncbi:MAG: YbaB/EbfC family nucleoid-associated protein [Spiroplasma sp. WSS]|nr:MAG: YbaB/EbfC family nucleoid-associated protein [Spiroplasma sp. WSS]